MEINWVVVGWIIDMILNGVVWFIIAVFFLTLIDMLKKLVLGFGEIFNSWEFSSIDECTNFLIESSKKTFVVGLVCDVSRLLDVRRNRIHSMHEDRPSEYINEKKISSELENSKKIFKKYNWPVLDVTRKSVEETAASIIKILDILNSKWLITLF